MLEVLGQYWSSYLPPRPSEQCQLFLWTFVFLQWWAQWSPPRVSECVWDQEMHSVAGSSQATGWPGGRCPAPPGTSPDTVTSQAGQHVTSVTSYLIPWLWPTHPAQLVRDDPGEVYRSVVRSPLRRGGCDGSVHGGVRPVRPGGGGAQGEDGGRPSLLSEWSHLSLAVRRLGESAGSHGWPDSNYHYL